jgi:hypothetical protein
MAAFDVPALGFTPAQTRAKGLWPLDSRFARAGLDADAPFPAIKKEVKPGNLNTQFVIPNSGLYPFLVAPRANS